MKSVRQNYKSYLDCIDGARAYNNFKSKFYTIQDSVVDHVVIELENHFQSKKLDVLDIGGGDGKRIIQILKTLHTSRQLKFSLDFIEQSEAFMNEFEVSNYSIKSYTDINTYHSDFEKVHLSNRYDVILLIHSIFAFNEQQVIADLVNKLSENGVIIIVSNSDSSFLAKAKKEVDSIFLDQRIEISNVRKLLLDSSIHFSESNFNTIVRIAKHQVDDFLSTLLEWLTLGHKNLLTTKKSLAISRLLESSIYKEDEEYLYLIEKEVLIKIPALSSF